jgi:D-aminopeptidase
MPKRFRDAFPGLVPDLGYHPTGPRNAITDVPGVRVGHATVRDPAKGWFSGVTAIWPRADVYDFRPHAAGHVLHGAGEMTGLHQVVEWGLVETPILLTSTLNVGRVYDATIEYLAEKHPRMGLKDEVLIPVVAECDDSFLSRARERPVGPAEVRAALDGASDGPVAEGGVGAGTGMMAFEYKGGIGTSSRRVRVGPKDATREFTVGALVNANVGVRRQLRLAGRLVGRALADRDLPEPHSERSIIVILATDAPMRPDQLRRLCVRAGLGLGRVGSYASHGSGEIILGFTTALGEPRSPVAACSAAERLHDAFLSSFYEAVVECVEESVLNAMAAGGALEGRDGHRVHGLVESAKPLGPMASV